MGIRYLKIKLALIALTFFLFGCEVDMSVVIDGSNPPTFTLSGTGNLVFFNVMEVPPENQEQSIQRSSDKNKLLWKIRPSRGGKDKIRTLPPIKYGVVPSGFEQVFPADGAPPVPLTEGRVYEAIGTAYNSNGGLIWFRVNEQKSWSIPTP
jgi:hypothetical protein